MSENSEAVAVVGETANPLQEIELREEVDHGHVAEGGLSTAGESAGIIELAVPNLLPTDNVVEVHEASVHRIKIPMRITNVDIFVVDNGYKVRLPHAGRQNPYGSDGAEHVFAGPTAKHDMLEFVALVIGQVTYQYREVEAETFERIQKRRARRAARAEPLATRDGSLDEDVERAHHETLDGEDDAPDSTAATMSEIEDGPDGGG